MPGRSSPRAAARNLHPGGAGLVQERRNGMNDRQLTWRAAPHCAPETGAKSLAAIDAMSKVEARWPSWRYWKAQRAGRHLGGSRKPMCCWRRLSNEFNFYGQLAAEELGTPSVPCRRPIRPTTMTWKLSPRIPASEARAGAVQGRPALRRRAGMAMGASRITTTSSCSPPPSLRRTQRLVRACDRHRGAHGGTARLRAALSRAVPRPGAGLRRQLDLDEAWVYGLVRQESRFVHTARSSAGASGLMQLMPSTARWVAKRLGMTGHHATLTETIDTNISLGTYYLRQVHGLRRQSGRARIGRLQRRAAPGARMGGRPPAGRQRSTSKPFRSPKPASTSRR